MREGEMQSEEMSFQSAFERGQRLGCPDVYRKVIPRYHGRLSTWNYSVNMHCACYDF